MSEFLLGDGAVQISADEIQSRIKALGAQITADYQGEQLHVVGVLNGSYIFMADLVRVVDLPITMDFLALSSYGLSTRTSGEVELIKDLRLPISGKHVLVVEDIVDTGITLDYLKRMLEARQPLSLKVASLLSKPSRRKIEAAPDYLGFEIEDAYVYGYGLDRAQFDRNLPFITSVKSD